MARNPDTLFVGSSRVRVFSRNAKDWTDKVPAIAEAMRALPVTSATLDGEGVVIDDRGITDFERLRTALAGRGGSRSVFLYGFDLVELDGNDLRREPWEHRRVTLTGCCPRRAPASACPSTSTATARRSSGTPALGEANDG